MKILLDGDEVNIRVGDWVSNNTGIQGQIIKIDDLSETVLVGKPRAFGSWIDASTITGLESDGGYSSSFSRMVDEEYKPYHRKEGKVDTAKYERYLEEKFYDDVKPDKAMKEHSKNGIDKPQFSLIPQHAILEVAKVFTYGAKKYNAYNYSKGEKNITYTDAAMRHINQYLLGIDNDDETNLSHLAHAVSNLLMVIDNTIIGTNIEGRNGLYKL